MGRILHLKSEIANRTSQFDGPISRFLHSNASSMLLPNQATRHPLHVEATLVFQVRFYRLPPAGNRSL
jgi:hypothetical protein